MAGGGKGPARDHAKRARRRVGREQRESQSDGSVGYRRHPRLAPAAMKPKAFLEFLDERTAVRIPARDINAPQIGCDLLESREARFRDRQLRPFAGVRPPERRWNVCRIGHLSRACPFSTVCQPTRGAFSSGVPIENLYLHIGSGKTGTTAIQRFLSLHRAELLAAGLHYVAADDGARMGQQNFAKSFIRHPPSYMEMPAHPERAREEVRKELVNSASPHALLSSENLTLG